MYIYNNVFKIICVYVYMCTYKHKNISNRTKNTPYNTSRITVFYQNSTRIFNLIQFNFGYLSISL